MYKVVGGSGDGAVPLDIEKALSRGREGHENRSKMRYFIKLTLGEFGVDEAKVKAMVGGLWK